MRISFLKSAPFLPITGADISMFERLQLLRLSHGWDTEAVCVENISKREGLLTVLNNLKPENIDFTQHQEDILYRFCDTRVRLGFSGVSETPSSEQPSCDLEALSFLDQAARSAVGVVLVNIRDVAAVIAACRRNTDQTIAFLTEDEYLRPAMCEESPLLREYADCLHKLKAVYVASHFLKESFRQSWGIEAKKLTNAIDLSRYQVENRAREFIGFLQPTTHKGVEVFLQLAEKLPDKKFLVAGGIGADYRRWKPELLARPNITLATYEYPPTAFYSRCWLILVPSLWNEAFSRVTMEALSCGCQVMASAIGGIREAGGAGVTYLPVYRDETSYLARADSAEWAAAIISLESNPAEQNRLRTLSKKHVESFRQQLNSDIATFSDFLARHL